MKNCTTAARAAITPENLSLPIEPPRDAWPALIEHAADALTRRCVFDTATLALELLAIADAMRKEVRA